MFKTQASGRQASKTNNQSQEEGLSIVNHAHGFAAQCPNVRDTTYCCRKTVYLLLSVAMVTSLNIHFRLCCGEPAVA